MPHGKLPHAFAKHPKEDRKILDEVFRSAMKEYGDEGKAIATAYSALEKHKNKAAGILDFNPLLMQLNAATEGDYSILTEGLPADSIHVEDGGEEIIVRLDAPIMDSKELKSKAVKNVTSFCDIMGYELGGFKDNLSTMVIYK